MAASTDLSSLEAELQRKRQELARMQQRVLKAECGKRSQKNRRTGMKFGSKTRAGTRTRQTKAAGSSKQESGTSTVSSAILSQREQLLPEQSQSSGTSSVKAGPSPELSSTASTAKLSHGELYTVVESEIESPTVTSLPLTTTYTPEQLHVSVAELADESVQRPRAADSNGPNRSKKSTHKHGVAVLSQASSLVRRSLDPHSPIWIEGLSYPAQYLVRQTRSMSARQEQGKQSSDAGSSSDGRDCREVCVNKDILAGGSEGRGRKKVCEGEQACEITSEDEQTSSVGSKEGVQNSSVSIEVCSSKQGSDAITQNSPSTKITTDTSDQKQIRRTPGVGLDSHSSSRDDEGVSNDDSTSTGKERFSGNSSASPEMDEWPVSQSELCGSGKRKRVDVSKSSVLSLPPTDSRCSAINTAAAISSPHTCLLDDDGSVLCHHHGCRSPSKCTQSSHSEDPPVTLKVSVPITHNFPMTVSQDPRPDAQTACSGHSRGNPEAADSTSARERLFPLFSPNSLTHEQWLRLASDFFLPDDSFQALKLLKLRQQQALRGGGAIRRRVKPKRAQPSCCDSPSSQSEISQTSVLASPLRTLEGSSQGRSDGSSQTSQTSQSGSASQRSGLKPERSRPHPLHATSLPSPPLVGSPLPSRRSRQNSDDCRTLASGHGDESLGRCRGLVSRTETESDDHEHLHSNLTVENDSPVHSELSSASSDRDRGLSPARAEGRPRALMSCSFVQMAGGRSVETSELQHRASLPCAYQAKPTAGGNTFQGVVKQRLLVTGGGRRAAGGVHIGMCLAGGLCVYTLTAARRESKAANWGNCPRHSWTLGEGETIHCCCLVSCEADLLLCAGGELGDSGVRLYIAGGSSQQVLQLQACSSEAARLARGGPCCCPAVCSWLAAAEIPRVTVVAALLPPSGEGEAVAVWTISKDDGLWVQTSYHTLPLPAEMGRVTSLNHVTRHVTHREEEEEEGSCDWVVGIRGLMVLLWDASEGTLLQTAALSCGGCVAGPPLRAQPVGLAAFREESVVFLLIGCEEHDQAQPQDSHEGHTQPQDSHEGHTQPQDSHEGHTQPQDSHEGHTQPQGSHEGHTQPQGSHEGHTQPQDSQTPPDTTSQSVCWLLAMNASPSAGESGGSECGHPTHCRLVQTYSCPREVAGNPVAMPPATVCQCCSLSGWPRHLGVALSHDTVLLWDLMHSDPWAKISLSGVDSLQSFHWLGDRNHLFLALDHCGSLHVFS